jgi:6-pyruvoyltetrahydropterin/6-carboxytetrahydropterin synthase
MYKGTLTRVFEFDAAHRVMNERVKCFNLHGHRFKVELTISYTYTGELGYAIDFKEIKRVFGEFLDKHFDHTCILNPLDTDLINLCRKNNWRLWVMGLGNTWDINPSAENMASELLYVAMYLFKKLGIPIRVSSIKLYETPNCWVEESFPMYQANDKFLDWLNEETKDLAPMEYDARKVK